MEQIITYFKTLRDSRTHNIRPPTLWIEHIDLFIKILEKATAQKSGESVVRQGTDGESGAVWRRIDTDKPPQGKDVLFVHDGEVMNGFLTWTDKYTIYGIPYDEVDEKNITYWMPLPKPPDA